MGIAPYKYFTYDGKSSRDYDVYLTGEGVFNAPERAVEMLEIPGRNGNYALDQGKFNNISVTYKAGIVDVSESNFADKVSAVRNWLCSKVGYKRLSDDYNPNEYRMAVFKSGVNIDHVDLKTGEFEITFDCKPQRWLTSGETAVSVADGGTLNNPTPFEASPLLAVKGYGNIDIGGQDINIENIAIGQIIIGNAFAKVASVSSATQPLDTTNMNANDEFNTANVIFNFEFRVTKGYYKIDTFEMLSASNCSATKTQTASSTTVRINPTTYTFYVGTSDTQTSTVDFRIKVRNTQTSTTSTSTGTITCTVAYYNGSNIITYSISGTAVTNIQKNPSIGVPSVYGISTKSALGNPMYIDLDIGEAWNEDSGEVVSVNEAVQLGSDLPVLPSGTTEINYDNTITELKVTPRWWKV